MNKLLFQLILYFIIYLCGSFPSAYVITKIFAKKDILKIGSGNVGARNVYENVSKKLGIITFALDFSKAVLAFIIYSKYNLFFTLSLLMLVLGHNFSIYLKFKGGKGLASTLTFLLLKNPLLAIFSIIIYLITNKTIKNMALSVRLTIALLLILTNIFIERDIFISLLLWMALTIKWLPNKRNLANKN